MNPKIESLEEIKNQEINYFRVIWDWKWAAILIPLIAMATAKLTEQPIPNIYETKASLVISAQGSQQPLSQSSFESIAFLPKILEKIIDQLSLKMADGTSMNQSNLKNQLKTKISGSPNPNAPVAPGFLFFFARNESPRLAKRIADLWVQLVEKEAKRIETLSYTAKGKPNNALTQRMLNLKTTQINDNTRQLMDTELKLAETKSELATYQKRLKTFADSEVHLIPKNMTIIQRDPSTLKKENSSLSIETTLHLALKALILKKELEIKAFNSRIRLLKAKLKKREQELFEMLEAQISGELLDNFSIWDESRTLKPNKDKFVSNIASINYAPLINTPVERQKYTHIFLAGIISFGLILLVCILKAHVDALRQEQKIGN